MRWTYGYPSIPICVISIALVAPLMPDLPGEVQLTGVEV
jgi:hypothetical protein